MYQGKRIIQPPFLKKGDKVALIAPAYWVAEEAILMAADVLRGWELEPVIGVHSNNLNVDAYAGTADERATDLMNAFEDDSIKAIICSRGGYGSIHLMNRIPLEVYQQHPKWLLGHGDVSILLNAMVAAGVMCVHGPMGFQIAAAQEPTSTVVRDLLFGTVPQYKVAAHACNRCGHAEGVLVGGNLSSYASVTKTTYHLSPDQDIILFIEDLEESLHSIDRLFYSLLLQPDFKRVKGVILGTFTSIRYDLQFSSVEQMLIEHLKELDIPVCCGFPVGSDICLPLIEGAPCTLDVTEKETLLTFQMEGASKVCEIQAEQVHLMREKMI